MKSIYWGFATLVLMVALVFVLVLTDTLLIDSLRAITSGSVLGAVAFFINATQEKPSQRGMFLLFTGVLGGLAGFVTGWIIMALVYLPLLGGTFIGTAAELFAFSTGIVGACSLIGFVLSQPSSTAMHNKTAAAPKQKPTTAKAKTEEKKRIEPTLNMDDVTL